VTGSTDERYRCVSHVRPKHGYLAAGLGALTAGLLLTVRMSPLLLAGLFAVTIVLLLPRLRPGLVGAFVVGLVGAGATALAVVGVLWSTYDWKCGEVVNGTFVEHDCSQPPTADPD
jgi:hypothetical protein